ncbi:MAG TPA: helix-turn-helix domain-containing protein [Pedobacter sp.]
MIDVKIKHLEFNSKLPVGFEIIDVDDHYANAKKNLASPHRASFYCIIWFEKGDVIHQVDFNQIIIQANTFLFVRKDAVQFFDHQHKFNSQVLLFTDTFFSKNSSDHQFLKSTPLFNDLSGTSAYAVLTASPLLQILWKLMKDEFNHRIDQYKPDMLRNHLHTFMLSAERERKEQGHQEVQPHIQLDYLILFKDQLEKHFHEQQKVGFYADKLAITNKVLTNATQKITGKTPKQLADERVLLEAKRLLIYSNGTGKTIGFSLGFEEPTNFIKFFRKQTGLTPTAFRTRYLS